MFLKIVQKPHPNIFLYYKAIIDIMGFSGQNGDAILTPSHCSNRQLQPPKARFQCLREPCKVRYSLWQKKNT